jgi:hypothetical protein
MGLWGIVIGAALLAGIIALWINSHNRQGQLDDINAQLKALDSQKLAAQVTVDRLKYGRGYFGGSRPPVLDCLKELSGAFEENEKIWATNLTFRENGKGQITGKAADQGTILALLNRLKKNKHFSDVKAPEQRESDTRSHEWSYTISFDYTAE